MSVSSRLAQRPPWLARLSRLDDGRVVGAGVLVDASHVLTCAHVVGQQVGEKDRVAGRGNAPVAEVPVEFPFTGGPVSRRATVVGWQPIDPDGSGDVAVLRLDSPVTLVPAPLACPETVSGHPFSAHGFPGGEPAARQATGTQRGASGPSGEWVQIDADRPTGWSVEHGFSGAPVFDYEADAVVGIVALMDKHRTGHQLPVSYLRTVWPELGERIGWRLDLDPDWETHWGPRARGSDIEADNDTWYFTGRQAARQAICDWLGDLSGAEPDVMVVTGGPGTGKSALLSHLLVSADRLLSREVPTGGPRPPLGAFDVAIHLRSLTCDEVVARLAAVVDIAVEDEDRLLVEFRKRDQSGGWSCTILADAVEEAATVKEAKLIATLLCRLARIPSVRVLAGVRTAPEGSERAAILKAFGPRTSRVDLESREFLHRNDIAEYVRTYLTDTKIGSTVYQDAMPNDLHTISWAVARQARYNFLIAQLTSRWLAHPSTPRLDLDNPSWEGALPETIGEAMDSYLDTCGPDAPLIRRLLTTLAFARGDGLTRDDLWLALTDALHPGHAHSRGELETVFHSAANYLVERTSSRAENATYRLYHDALDQHLRDECPHRAPEQTIVASLLARTPPDRDGHRDWGTADIYTRVHLAGHAAASGRLDDMLAEVGYLINAEPGPLLAVLHQTTTEQGKLTAAVYRTSSYDHRHAEPGRRCWILALDAARFGASELHARLNALLDTMSEPHSHWRARFATGSSANPINIATLVATGLSAAAVGDWEGRLIAVVGESGGVARVWDLAEQREVAHLAAGPHRLRAIAVGYRNGHSIVLTSSSDTDDRTIVMWDLDEQDEIGRLSGHTGAVQSIKIGESAGRPIAVTGCDAINQFTGDSDGTVRIWDLIEQRQVGAPLTSPADSVLAFALGELSGEAVVITTHRDKSSRIWDLATHREIGRLTGHTDAVTAVAIAEVEGHTIAITGSEDTTVRIWDVAERREIGELPSHTGIVDEVMIGTWGGNLVAYTLDDANRPRIWDVSARREIGTLTGHIARAVPLVIRNWDDRSIVVTRDGLDSVRVWDLSERHLAGEAVSGHAAPVEALALTRLAGKPIALIGTAGEGELQIWDLTEYRRIGDPIGHGGRVAAIAPGVLAGGPIALTGVKGKDTAVRMWDLAERQEIGRLLDHARVCSLAIARLSGSPVAITSDDTAVRVWSLTGPRHIATFAETAASKGVRYRAKVIAVADLEGLPVVVTGDGDGAVVVWDLATRIPIGKPMTGHHKSIIAIAAGTAAGRTVAVTAGTDRTVRIWDLATQLEIGQLTVTTNGVDTSSIALSQWDGHPIVVTAHERTVRIWDLETRNQLDELPLPSGSTRLDANEDGMVVAGFARDIVVMTPVPGTFPDQPAVQEESEDLPEHGTHKQVPSDPPEATTPSRRSWWRRLRGH